MTFRLAAHACAILSLILLQDCTVEREPPVAAVQAELRTRLATSDGIDVLINLREPEAALAMHE